MVELLAPAGNFDCVRAAVNSGADAVYLGGRLFNARAYAANFSDEELQQVCDFCHDYGVKVYVTVNTLYRNDEYPELVAYIDRLYAMGVDGLIMQDLGAISLVRKYWTDLPVHASTQLTGNGRDDIALFEKLGCRMAVLSRELSIPEIRNIVESTKIKVETFIHGALCVCYSGQCLMSSVVNDRSGNRGKCSQNCRLYYDLYRNGNREVSGHLLSPKDICVLDVLPQLLDTGVASLKVEGRMKSKEYVAGVIRIYRKYIDLYYSGQKYEVEESDRDQLLQLFNRGYFSQGYLNTFSGSDMMCPVHPKNWGVLAGKVTKVTDREITVQFEKDMYPGDGIEIWTDDEDGIGCYINKPVRKGESFTFRLTGKTAKGKPVYRTFQKKLMDELSDVSENITRKTAVNGIIEIKSDRPVKLTLSALGHSVTVEGEEASQALSQPLSREFVRQQISRMGNTIFALEDLKVNLQPDVYVNRSALNDVKNRACSLLKEQIEQAAHRNLKRIVLDEKEPLKTVDLERRFTVKVATIEQLETALKYPEISAVYCDSNPALLNRLDEVISAVHNAGKLIYFAMPRIWRQYVIDGFRKEFEKLENSATDGYLISCPGHLDYLKDSQKKLITDFTANAINSYSADFWISQGAEKVTLSIETSYDEIMANPDRSRLEILGYGRLPLMITHQCPVGNYCGGKKNGKYCSQKGNSDSYTLKDRNNSYQLVTDCRNCICTIYSEKPLYAVEAVDRTDCHIRLSFLDESGTEMKKVIDSFVNDRKADINGTDLYLSRLQ